MSIPSGSGPLLSLRVSAESFSAWSALKNSGRIIEVSRSRPSPESQTCRPAPSRMVIERAPKACSCVTWPALFRGEVVVMFSRPRFSSSLRLRVREDRRVELAESSLTRTSSAKQSQSRASPSFAVTR